MRGPKQKKAPGRKKILVVEDDSNVRGMILQLLTGLEEHCDVIEASDGKEALFKASAGEFDLIILDIFLPTIDGFEFCQQVRKTASSEKIKILAVTGYPEDDSIKKIYDAGADLCIMKPLHLDHFRQEIKRLLSEK